MRNIILTFMAFSFFIPTAYSDLIQKVEQGLRDIKAKANSQTFSIFERMKYYKVPGVSIAVIDQGQLAWTKGYGISEVGRAERVTPETVFQAGSISKVVAALGALYLVQDGVLQLDRDVNHYLKSWQVSENNYTRKEKVTLRRLLSHSAGLTVAGFPGYLADVPLPTTVQVLNGTKGIANTDPVVANMAPGTSWRYSGVERQLSSSLSKTLLKNLFLIWMKEKVLTFLDMQHSAYQQPLRASILSNASSAHLDHLTPVPGRWHNYPE